MSKKTVEKYYSDLSNEEILDFHSPLSFAFEGAAYEIDLTDSEKIEFESLLQKYINAARLAGRAASPKRGQGSKLDPKVVRAWASENDVEVPARGRIPAGVIAAYQQANR